MAGLDRRLKLVRRLAQARQRQKLGLFVVEGEDLVAAARELKGDQRAGWQSPRVQGS